MNYVKHFSINGIDTTQVACIELNGKPNAATVGAVGVLGMDMTSPTREVYKCVAVNGSIYTWELLSAGMSIISAKITGEGGASMSFPYSTLLAPTNYLIKMGDLILDSEGYLYQISEIGNESCSATYCGTHIGGIPSGDKDYSLVVVDGKLQLVTESGNIISSIDYLVPDDASTIKDSEGKIRAIGVYTIGDSRIQFFVGTQAEYNSLNDKRNVLPFIKNDPLTNDVEVPKAQVAEVATYASADKSKGTIEERLSALGFKDGVVSLAGSAETSRENMIQKIGTSVIGRFWVKCLNVPIYVENGDSMLRLGTVPEEFRPQVTKIFQGWGKFPLMGGFTSCQPITVKIFPNGDLIITNSSYYTLSAIDSPLTWALVVFNFGYDVTSTDSGSDYDGSSLDNRANTGGGVGGLPGTGNSGAEEDHI